MGFLRRLIPRTTITRARLLWAVGVVVVAGALAWQALYELEMRACGENADGLMILCAGPLDAWVLPLTLIGALVLLIAGGRMLSPNRSEGGHDVVWIRRVRALGLVVLLAYMAVWGVSWMTGDRSTGVFGWSEAGGAFQSYPGVFLGGLPPNPGIVSDAPPALGAVVGIGGLVVLLVRRVRKVT